MHIVEGALSLPVLTTGAVLTATGVAVGLKQMDLDRLPQVGVLSATCFVASLVHVPIGPSNVHLILNGLIGLTLLGWSAFPALLIALLLQAVFSNGNMAAPGVLVEVFSTRETSSVRPLPKRKVASASPPKAGSNIASVPTWGKDM